MFLVALSDPELLGLALSNNDNPNLTNIALLLLLLSL